MKDFYKKKHGNRLSCDFENTLVDYLQRQGMPESISKRVRDFDFSTTEDILVTSVPGYHRDDSLTRYGHMKVRQYLSRCADSTQPIIAQFSSLGSLTKDWLE